MAQNQRTREYKHHEKQDKRENKIKEKDENRRIENKKRRVLRLKPTDRARE